jgi:hypothetical protein
VCVVGGIYNSTNNVAPSVNYSALGPSPVNYSALGAAPAANGANDAIAYTTMQHLINDEEISN